MGRLNTGRLPLHRLKSSAAVALLASTIALMSISSLLTIGSQG